MTIDSTVGADTLTIIFTDTMEASLGKEDRQSREGGKCRQSRSRYSRSGDSYLCRKGLCRVFTTGSCRFSWANEGQPVSLHFFQGIAALSDVSGSPRTSEFDYHRSRCQEFGTRGTFARICSQLGRLLRDQSGTSKYLFPRISPSNGQRSRNRKAAAERFPGICAWADRGRSQSWINPTRSRYSNRFILLANSCKRYSYFLTSSARSKSSTNSRRNFRSSLFFNPYSRFAKGQVNLANSSQFGFAKFRVSNQLTGVTS
jgi:hypothetical protein